MQGGHPPNTKRKSSLHSRRPTLLNQKVHFGGKSTTNVLEPYIWNSINAILQQETINNGCILQGAKYRQTAFHPSLGSAHCGSSLLPHFSRRLTVSPSRLLSIAHRTTFRSYILSPIKFRHCHLQSSDLRKTKRMTDGLPGVRDLS